MLEPTLSFEERYKTGILKAAAKIKDGEIPVRLFKLTPVDKRIYKGMFKGLDSSSTDESLLARLSVNLATLVEHAFEAPIIHCRLYLRYEFVPTSHRTLAFASE